MLDLSSGAWAALALGFLLGLKHATDADHVVAVTTIATESRNPLRGLWVGAWWGLGHTTPLLIAGVVILMLNEALLARYEAIAPMFEFLVGVMLVLLGAQVFYNLKRGRVHVHSHLTESRPHVHIHGTHPKGQEQELEEDPGHDVQWRGLPALRIKSYWVGVVHGLAGSAAVMLALLPRVDGMWLGFGYLLLFGVGTIMSMGALTIVLGVPFALTNRAPALSNVVVSIAGALSVAFGVALMLEIALDATIIPI